MSVIILNNPDPTTGQERKVNTEEMEVNISNRHRLIFLFVIVECNDKKRRVILKAKDADKSLYKRNSITGEKILPYLGEEGTKMIWNDEGFPDEYKFESGGFMKDEDGNYIPNPDYTNAEIAVSEFEYFKDKIDVNNIPFVSSIIYDMEDYKRFDHLNFS